MYQLYYSPGACSMAIHVLLNELAVPYEAIKVDIRNKSPELLKVNPRGQVPVLVDDGFVILEGAAQMVYLLDKHPNPLLPKSGKERAKALECLMFGNATLHPAYSKLFFLMGNLGDKVTESPLFTAAFDQVVKLWKDVDAQLGKTKYIAGDTLTQADILLAVIANWNMWLPKQVPFGENAKRLFKEISARPSYLEALASEQIEYKAAA